jgi:16S rRNA (cytosine967-C5)-methyltransferase
MQQLNGVRLVQLDATNDLPFTERSFDRVLVDAPCSGTGTLRRNPEIRWKLRPDDICALSLRQRQILSNAARLLKSSGRLVYSTCSVEREENEDVVNDFLRNHQGFTFAPLESQRDAKSNVLRTWPHREGSDGFFLTAFEKKS